MTVKLFNYDKIGKNGEHTFPTCKCPHSNLVCHNLGMWAYITWSGELSLQNQKLSTESGIKSISNLTSCGFYPSCWCFQLCRDWYASGPSFPIAIFFALAQCHSLKNHVCESEWTIQVERNVSFYHTLTVLMICCPNDVVVHLFILLVIGGV